MTRSVKGWQRFALRLAVALIAVVFVTAHGAMLYRMATGSALPFAAVASGMMVLAALKHLGLFGALWAAFRRRFF
jgi:hypothetical protein